MKISDYIVKYLIEKNVKDVFGYPGGMVTHLMESLRQEKSKIKSHLLYHEQSLSFAACAYSQNKNEPSVVYATSGPGATNLITGICNAYFDSIPVIFITGQVNSFESSQDMKVRQRGFQETNIVKLTECITKKSFYVDDPRKIKKYLDMAFYYAIEGRKGPVVLDIPMNIFRADVCVESLEAFEQKDIHTKPKINLDFLSGSKRPVLLLGAGAKNSVSQSKINKLLEKINCPLVTSMIAFDIIEKESKFNFGFVGAYGHRTANFILAKADLVISIGSRMDIRQVGIKRESFAPNARIIRFDIDPNEMEYSVHEDDLKIKMSANDAVDSLIGCDYSAKEEWMKTCVEIRERLKDSDPVTIQKKVFDILNEKFLNSDLFTADVGQNQVWVAQYLKNKEENKVYFSGGHGAMGYSLPASIGLSYANPNRRIISFSGDGGFQMNIQELQTIARDKLPVICIIFNNSALGMIRHFQEMYFDCKYMGTTNDSGYESPQFFKIGQAYGIKSIKVDNLDHLKSIELPSFEPMLIEIMINENTYIIPKLEFGKPNQDQEPLIDRELFKIIMEL